MHAYGVIDMQCTTTHNVPFPPISVFVDFIIQQEKIENEIYFDFTLSFATPGLKQHKAPVAVHKANVSPTEYPYRSSQFKDIVNDPSKWCPLPRKPHSLLKCTAFRGSP